MELITRTEEELESDIKILLQSEIYPTYERFNETKSLSTIAFLDEKLQRLSYLIHQLDQCNSLLANHYKERARLLLTKDELLDEYLSLNKKM